MSRSAASRKGLYALGALLIIGAASAIVVAIIAVTDKDDKTTNTPVSAALGSPAKQACSIFTLANAKRLLGDSATGGANDEDSSSDIAVSSCTYSRNTGSNAPVSASDSATLLVRTPKTRAGTASNQNQFGRLQPDNAQTVSGYGSRAYWDPQYGQLNILKINTWYILSFGSITPADRTLAQAEQMANLLINKM